MKIRGLPYALLLLVLTGCASRSSASLSSPQQAFWSALHELCGRAFNGMVRQAPQGDTTFAGKELVMHVRQCSDHEIRIPFHVGTNRSRTWILSLIPAGLRLKHDHRHEDGSEDTITQYGGDSRGPGSTFSQEFFADAHTATLIPAAATNVWTIELQPGRSFVYALRREGTNRRFRIEFDLKRPRPVPPDPWGYD